MNKSKTHLREGQMLANKTSQSLLHDFSLALDSSFPNASELVGDKSAADFTQIADVSRSKSKSKVNELGALGTLKNLSRILNQQESTLNAGKGAKPAALEAILTSEGGSQPPQASLSSH